MSIDKSIIELYILILNKRAKIVHCIEYKQHYEIHLEWEQEKPLGYTNEAVFFDDAFPWDWVRNELVAIVKGK